MAPKIEYNDEIIETDDLVVEVKNFELVKPKFSKEAWESGEGGGEGTSSDGDDSNSSA